MLYQHSSEIHERLEAVLGLIQTGEYSTPALAEKIGVSIPTVSRIVAALRARGNEIRAERHDGYWRYVLVPGTPSKPARIAKGSNRHPSGVSSVASGANRHRDTTQGQ